MEMQNEQIFNFRNIYLIIILSSLWNYNSKGEVEKFPISIDKITTLIFKGNISTIETGSRDYHIKSNGRCILIRAKKETVPSTSLFVIYGKEKRIFVGEIYAEKQAPIKHIIDNYEEKKDFDKIESNKKQKKIWSKGAFQKYQTYGTKKYRIKVILTNLAVSKTHLYLRFFIENNSSVHLKLTNYRFEYIEYLRSLIIFSQEKREEVTAELFPQEINLKPKSCVYHEFGIPIRAVNGELEINLSEEGTERNFQIIIPSKIILKAKTIRR